MRSLLPALPLIVALMPCACSSPSAVRGGPYESSPVGSRDPLRAQQLTLEAADLMERDPQRAEVLLREALAADLWHGPAHNNLGVLHLRQERLYEAAEEFEWARKLLPGHPDPRMNLGFVLEKAGRIDAALATYDTALEVYPGHLPTMRALARLQIREQRTDGRTDGFLSEIALRGPDAEWREWALLQLAKRGAE